MLSPWFTTPRSSQTALLPLLQEVLRLAPLKLGTEHPVELVAICNLAQVRENQKNIPEAARQYKEAIAAQRRVLGDTHPDTLTSLVKFGNFCAEYASLDEAESVLTEGSQAAGSP